MKTLTCIFLVFGNQINNDFSNVKAIDTKVIPNKDDFLALKEGVYLVTGRYINYKNVEDYTETSPDRGGELIYIYLERVK